MYIQVSNDILPAQLLCNRFRYRDGRKYVYEMQTIRSPIFLTRYIYSVYQKILGVYFIHMLASSNIIRGVFKKSKANFDQSALKLHCREKVYNKKLFAENSTKSFHMQRLVKLNNRGSLQDNLKKQHVKWCFQLLGQKLI